MSSVSLVSSASPFSVEEILSADNSPSTEAEAEAEHDHDADADADSVPPSLRLSVDSSPSASVARAISDRLTSLKRRLIEEAESDNENDEADEEADADAAAAAICDSDLADNSPSPLANSASQLDSDSAVDSGLAFRLPPGFRAKRRRLTEIPDRERWRCSNAGCGREYKRTSTTSIGQHRERCANNQAANTMPMAMLSSNRDYSIAASMGVLPHSTMQQQHQLHQRSMQLPIPMLMNNFNPLNLMARNHLMFPVGQFNGMKVQPPNAFLAGQQINPIHPHLAHHHAQTHPSAVHYSSLVPYGFSYNLHPSVMLAMKNSMLQFNPANNNSANKQDY